MVTYLFRVIFESGLEYETTKVELTIKLKCKPLTTPPNTELREVSEQFTLQCLLSVETVHVYISYDITNLLHLCK